MLASIIDSTRAPSTQTVYMGCDSKGHVSPILTEALAI